MHDTVANILSKIGNKTITTIQACTADGRTTNVIVAIPTSGRQFKIKTESGHVCRNIKATLEQLEREGFFRVAIVVNLRGGAEPSEKAQYESPHLRRPGGALQPD